MHPFGFVTCGIDKFIRVWSQQGSMVGEINLLKEKTRLITWKFGFDWKAKKRDELKQAQKVINKIKKMKERKAKGIKDDDDDKSDTEKSNVNSNVSLDYTDPTAQ